MSTATETVAGRFGAYGGRYVPETLMAALEELEHAYAQAQADPLFHAELDSLSRTTPAVPPRCTWHRVSPASWAEQRSTSNARICSTPAPTRSTTVSARDC